jgi:hypothetical protein
LKPFSRSKSKTNHNKTIKEMRKIAVLFLLLVLGFIGFNSCDKNKETAPKIPPYESMMIDLDMFSSKEKSALESDTTAINVLTAGLTILVWNTTLTVTLAVPIASFYASFQNEPEFLGDGTWQWSYDVQGFTNTYHARMTGKLMGDYVKWEMYISCTGLIGSHDEFLWFEGTSDYAGTNGQWILYHSYEVQEQTLKIDWKKVDDEIGDIKYTYVRESNSGIKDQLTVGSYLQFGLTDAELNAFYRLEYNQRDSDASDIKNVDIEWSLTEYFGRIKSQHYYGDDLWHCWDSKGYDTKCE